MEAVLEPSWVTIARTAILVAIVIYATLLFASGRLGTSFPISGIILAVLIMFYAFITSRTRTGRHIYAVGGNKAAAALSGVSVPKVYFVVMMNMSFLAAIAGILFVGRATSAGPSDGTMWELDAIAAVVVGGTLLIGGRGTIVGTVLGVLIFATLRNIFILNGLSTSVQAVAQGTIIVLAVLLQQRFAARGSS